MDRESDLGHQASDAEATAAAVPAASPIFEEAMGELEKIVEQLESTGLPLEQAISMYERGIELVRVCNQKLDEASGRIEQLVSRPGGEPAVEPYEVEND